MNNVDVIARKEFNDAIRSYALIAISVLFFLLTLALAGIYVAIDFFGGTGELTVEGMISFTTTGATVFVPVIAIVLTYKSIVGERNSGSLSLALSLPNTRQDVFFGKFVGRSAILLVAIFAAFVAGMLVTAWEFGFGAIGTFLLYVVLISLLGLVYVAIGLALSGATDSSILAAAGSLVIFGLFRFLWTPLWIALFALKNRLLEGEWLPPGTEETPTWLELGLFLNPHNAYGTIVDGVIYETPSGYARILIDQGDAFFANEWAGFIMVVLWIAVPLAAGFYRFDTVDL